MEADVLYNYIKPNLGKGGGGGNFTPPCWFSLNNSETVKAVTLAFSSIQENFLPNLVTLTCPSPQILGKLRRAYFRFLDFWSIPYKRKSS